MVLGGGGAGATVMPCIFIFVVNRQNRHGGDLRVRRKKGPDVQHSAERDVSEIRRSAVVPDDTAGKHGEGLRVVSEKFTRPLHADAAASVGMIHEDEFAPVGVRLFQRGKFPGLGTEWLVCDGLVPWQQQDAHEERCGQTDS